MTQNAFWFKVKLHFFPNTHWWASSTAFFPWSSLPLNKKRSLWSTRVSALSSFYFAADFTYKQTLFIRRSKLCRSLIFNALRMSLGSKKSCPGCLLSVIPCWTFSFPASRCLVYFYKRCLSFKWWLGCNFGCPSVSMSVCWSPWEERGCGWRPLTQTGSQLPQLLSGLRQQPSGNMCHLWCGKRIKKSTRLLLLHFQGLEAGTGTITSRLDPKQVHDYHKAENY